MGGMGSTRWVGRTRECVESCMTIAAPTRNSPVIGRLAWDDLHFYVTYLLEQAHVDLAYWRHERHIKERITLAVTLTPFGSRRWFICPGCKRKALYLHIPTRKSRAYYFRCQRCHDLSYESAQMSRSSTYNFFRRIGVQIGGDYRDGRRFVRERHGGYMHYVKRFEVSV